MIDEIIIDGFSEFLDELTEILNPDVYIVKKGDTLTKIAKICKTTVHKIKSLNNITTIKPGQKIYIK